MTATRVARSCHPSPVTRHLSAFTLIELLVVIAILGILAGLAVPALKNLGKSEGNVSAARQLLDDVGRARQLALANRTTAVYMVFVPPNFWNNLNYNNSATYNNWWNNLSAQQQSAATNMCDQQLAGYTFMAKGAIGDQPGNHQWHYLAPWQTLPEGTFIATNKFSYPGTVISSSSQPLYSAWNQDYPHSDQNTVYAFTNMVSVPFPTADSTNYISMPCIAFNYRGQLIFDLQHPENPSTRDEYIPLAHGSVADAADGNKVLYFAPPVVKEIPPGNSTNLAYNLVHIDALTGRAVLEYHKLP
jgi:prepilin-type N-terminal cleavage/methylation domain-containing protein